jgi:hypothetical protein
MVHVYNHTVSTGFYPLCKLKEKYGTNKISDGNISNKCIVVDIDSSIRFGSERVWSSFFLQYLWEFFFGNVH